MKIIKKGKEARQHLRNGINLVADCLKVTLGPQGRNATLGRKSTLPLTTNDGKTVSDYVEAEDELDQLGVLKAREASALTELQAGDGTTTVSVLLQAITNTLLDKIDNNKSLVERDTVNVVALRNELSQTCEKIVEELRKDAKPVVKKDDIFKVAKASVESEELAKMITEIFTKIGKDGSIIVEEGLFKTEYEVVCGMEINSGMADDEFFFEDEEIVLENVFAVAIKEIQTTEQFMPHIKKATESGASGMVIFSTEFNRAVLDSLLENNLVHKFKIYPVKITTVDRTYKPEDIQAMLGGEAGVCKTIKITDSKSEIIDGSGDTKEYVKKLKKEYDESKSEFDKEGLQKRISALSGGTAVIKVGANSQSEREYLRDKLEDAVLATKYAMQEGVVLGGGVALKKISERLPKNILSEVILEPYNQIQSNAGGLLDIPKDVVDPVRVTISALRNACSVAGIVITSEIVIADKNEKQGIKNEGGETLS